MTQQAATDPWLSTVPAEPIVREPRLIAVGASLDQPLDALAALGVGSCQPASARTRRTVRRVLLALADVTAVLVVLATLGGELGLRAQLFVALATTPLVLICFKLAGLYSRPDLQLAHSTLDDAPLLLQMTALLSLTIAIVLPVISTGSGLAGTRIAVVWLTMFIAILCGRMLARTIAGRVLPAERCLVLGDPRQAERIGAKFDAAGIRAEVVGCMPVEHDDLGQLAHPDAIRALVGDLDVDRLMVATASADAHADVELIRLARAVGVQVSLMPRVFEVVGASTAFDQVEGMAMVGVARFGLSRSSEILKRTLDIVGSSVAIVLLGPLMAAVAAAIRLDSSGAAFFRQTRVGRGGEHFQIVKFRSMVADAEARKEDLRRLSVAGDGLFKIVDDPRVTRIGNLLRKSSLDELPQLFNVLRGEMSLVGPRPLVRDEDAQIHGLDRSRLRLTPGVTGPWQLLTDRVPLQEMVGIDYIYATNWSLWLDLKIMLRTFGHVLRRGNV